MRNILFAATVLAGLGGTLVTSPAFAADAAASTQRAADDSLATGDALRLPSAAAAQQAPESVFAPAPDLFATRSHGYP